MPDAGWEPECEGGEGRFYVRGEERKVSKWGGRGRKGSYRSEDATKDEAQAVDVSVLVRVVFH